MKAMLLVGGVGKRLRPLTEDMPKPMVMIEGKPFLEYQIEWLKKQGFTEIIMLTGYKGEQIEDYFGDGSKFGVTIEYSGGREPMGTAGQITPVKDLVSEAFVVINGDTYFPIDLKKLIDFHKQKGAKATMALMKVKDTSRYGLVETDSEGRIVRFTEKGEPIEGVDTINGGIYILEMDVLKMISPGKVSLERDVFPKIKDLFGLVFDDYFIDIGTHETYEQFKEDMRKVMD